MKFTQNKNCVLFPNFLIIGSAKAGTTSLYYYLNQHPEIYMSPVKEPGFFALEGQPSTAKTRSYQIANLVEYQGLFRGVKEEKAIGEASVKYLFDPHAPHRIKHYIPQAKLIAVLRHPVDKIYSKFLHNIRDRVEPIQDFALAWEAGKQRLQDPNSLRRLQYPRIGFYYAKLQQYFDLFPTRQIRVYLYDDLQENSLEMIQDIFSFLEVDSSFVPD
ncbi:sulfotransferase [Oscillatoria salina]|uniref:sulfotransferase n=1 Tax=Oscillatoria salina TaxID=331517 RepID=UPI0013BB07D2|nr:sulfotransferase [Oscillatoria salina]MBZ8182773.1 sulfotransferase [Oscillatoria salina IIICB1]NET91411.1 sulfotransferase [Kamptonema sp. SIO1D9]